MKQQQTLTHNKSLHARIKKLYHEYKRPLFPLMLFCLGTFFIQAEDDETSMYITLVVIIVVIGLVNLVKWIFPKNHRRRDKDGHKPGPHHQHTHSDNGK